MVLDWGTRAVYRFARGGFSLAQATKLVQFTDEQGGLLVEAAGTFLVAYTGLARYERDGTLRETLVANGTFGASAGGAISLASDGTRFIYVPDAFAGKVWRVASNGSTVEDMGYPSTAPMHAVVSDAGKLFVYDAGEDALYVCADPTAPTPVWVLYTSVTVNGASCNATDISLSFLGGAQLTVACSSQLGFLVVYAPYALPYPPPGNTVPMVQLYTNDITYDQGILGFTPLRAEYVLVYGVMHTDGPSASAGLRLMRLQ